MESSFPTAFTVGQRRRLLIAISIFVVLSLQFKTIQWPASSAYSRKASKSSNKDDYLSEDNRLILQQIRTNMTAHFLRPRPPNTPGAIIHVGKSGGSTLASVLVNGCHSFVEKPCTEVGNETILSRITTYYHIPDWEILPNRSYDFYVWTLRDPFSRTVSAFRYCHPFNVLVRTRDYNEQVYNYRMKDMYSIYRRCFPTLDSFAQYLKFNYTRKTLIALNEAVLMNCEVLANAMLQYKAPRLNEHLHYNTGMFYRQTDHSKPVFAIRTTFLWHDWTRINELLGQKAGSVVVPEQSFRDSNKLVLPVGADIGDVEREYLCQALEAEYTTYFRLLSKAINIQLEDFVKMVEIAHENCPKLGLKKIISLSTSD